LKRIHRRIDIEANVSLSCFSQTWLFGVAEQPFFWNAAGKLISKRMR